MRFSAKFACPQTLRWFAAPQLKTPSNCLCRATVVLSNIDMETRWSDLTVSVDLKDQEPSNLSPHGYQSPPPLTPLSGHTDGFEETAAEGVCWWLDGSLPHSQQQRTEDEMSFREPTSSWDNTKTFEPLSPQPNSPAPLRRHSESGSPERSSSPSASHRVATTMLLQKDQARRSGVRRDWSPTSSPLARRRETSKLAAHMLLGCRLESQESPTDVISLHTWQPAAHANDSAQSR